MAHHLPIYELKNWVKQGRGHAIQFYATDDEVRGWLVTGLPQEYSPYCFVGQDLIRSGRKYHGVPFSYDIGDFPQCLEGPHGRRINLNILSRVLTPDLDFTKVERVDALCTINGLPGLQHGLNLGDKIDRSCLAIIDRVRNEQTGEVRYYDDYMKVYRRLRKLIRKSLVYSTIHTFVDGHEEEDFKLILMTEKSAENYNRGAHLVYKPGRRLDVGPK